MKRGMKYDFSLLALLLIPVGVAINVVGYQLSTILKLPIFLDQIGTTIVAIIAGPWVGLVTGGLSNLVSGMLNPIAIPFATVSMIIGLVTGYLSRWGLLTNMFGVIAAVCIHVISSSFVGTLTSIFVFGGVTGSGLDLITGAILASGQALFYSVFSSSIITGVLTSSVTIGVGLLTVNKIPLRYLSKVNYGQPYFKKRLS